MERRGSGIQRILNSYIDYTEQPAFYSDEYFFIVTLPNRSEARSAQLQLKIDTENSKPQLSSEKPQLSSNGKEKEELKKWLECKAGESFNKRNFEKLLELLKKYGSEYYFNRKTIANTFGISENAASRIIRKSMDCGVMRKEKNGEYYFNK